MPRNIEIARSYDWTSRNFLGIAYLDGKETQSDHTTRHAYGFIKLEAMDKDLQTEWYWESSGKDEKYWGQGGHRMVIADIDEDGERRNSAGDFCIGPRW